MTVNVQKAQALIGFMQKSSAEYRRTAAKDKALAEEVRRRCEAGLLTKKGTAFAYAEMGVFLGQASVYEHLADDFDEAVEALQRQLREMGADHHDGDTARAAAHARYENEVES